MNAIARLNTATAAPIRLPGLPDAATGPLAAFALSGARIRYERNAEIFGEGDETEFVYRVVSGAVRIGKVLVDGRRQISAFHLPGDLFGLEAGEEHRFTAEAVVDSEVLLVKRRAVLALAARDAEFAATLWVIAAADLGRAQDHMTLLGRKSAVERVAAFLLEMAERRHSADIVELPMSRYDIADYLGLTIETVSRTLSHLEDRATIELTASRRIALRNPSALRRLNA